MDEADDDFRGLLRAWMRSACRDWNYPEVAESSLDTVYRRLPPGVRALVAAGHRDQLIAPVGGYRFTLRDLPPGKGPYAWVSQNSQAKTPAMNWEYLVQAAEYARLHAVLSPRDYLIAFEDRLMDITVSTAEGDLRWYIEVKERAAEVARFAEQITEHGRAGVNPEVPGKDALRKAKYLLLYRPPYFSISAIGLRCDYLVTYTDDDRFTMTSDMVPLS